MSKMGISTIQSYRGAQIFEALGIAKEVMDRCFKGAASRVEGAGFAEIASEREMMHKEAFADIMDKDVLLESGGIYQWKKDGEYHM